jgi:hypothetical protein
MQERNRPREIQRPELVLLALAVALPQFAALAVEDRSCNAVPALATVELGEDAAAIRLTVPLVQQVHRLGHATQFADRPAQRRGALCTYPSIGGRKRGEEVGGHRSDSRE